MKYLIKLNNITMAITEFPHVAVLISSALIRQHPGDKLSFDTVDDDYRVYSELASVHGTNSLKDIFG